MTLFSNLYTSWSCWSIAPARWLTPEHGLLLELYMFSHCLCGFSPTSLLVFFYSYRNFLCTYRLGWTTRTFHILYILNIFNILGKCLFESWLLLMCIWSLSVFLFYTRSLLFKLDPCNLFSRFKKIPTIIALRKKTRWTSEAWTVWWLFQKSEREPKISTSK